MDKTTNKMYDSTRSSTETFFGELEGAEKVQSKHWKRRLIKPWGLLFAVEGSGKISLDSSEVIASKGSICLYKPDFCYTFTPCGSWRYIWFHFPIREHMLGQMDFKETIPGLGIWYPKQEIWNRILVELREAVALEKLHVPGWEPLAQLLVETVLQRIFLMEHSGKNRIHNQIQHAIQLLTGEKTYSISEIASECSLSVSLLFKIFREKVGCSPRTYREQFFLRQGKKMLMNTELSIDEIAKACHMCDRFYFSRRFKYYFGIAPVAFRNGDAPPKSWKAKILE